MTSYISGNASIGNFTGGALDVIELRVLSNLIQQQSGTASPDELRVLRNDQAFELGYVPPVVPGN